MEISLAHRLSISRSLDIRCSSGTQKSGESVVVSVTSPSLLRGLVVSGLVGRDFREPNAIRYGNSESARSPRAEAQTGSYRYHSADLPGHTGSYTGSRLSSRSYKVTCEFLST
ncbi:hypothetical protein J6590_039046 [Homalodisca vitripennis]|nr:hypothetical protein J6590_039046 [Homalodisca vitripennis]